VDIRTALVTDGKPTVVTNQATVLEKSSRTVSGCGPTHAAYETSLSRYKSPHALRSIHVLKAPLEYVCEPQQPLPFSTGYSFGHPLPGIFGTGPLCGAPELSIGPLFGGRSGTGSQAEAKVAGGAHRTS
jgi:hypothetical protein